MIKYHDEVSNMESSYIEEIQELKAMVEEKANELRFLREQKEEIQMNNHRMNELISS
jgi:hypothetical protein